ncbi:MAG: YdeI/OmpD-associated family protein [Chryseobacterium sp.]|jgi:uncharacterized protein YdeI (YjbR/CyaY-like superfamily)|uniref:YdeI/OmpD-associated family protein n=1 Tax=Chryseobacterium sp. TaxID=1871047 RepID=UPI0028260161|nr:YdeI/OmpD-associated family protein [Chryseobacterium sp.]MDR2235333.1 YdeI/OmpD-associated family protein [Chryseobacterium sp.]
MHTVNERPALLVETKTAWRQWLKENHQKELSIWLICNTKKSGLPHVSWSELVDEALCFGWIDSTRKTIDTGSFTQLFTKRKPNSTWSRINKEKVQRLTDDNLMTEAGHESIRIAKENGSWTILDTVEDFVIPQDLMEAFGNYTGSEKYFQSQSKSIRKMILQWIVLAKRSETRQKRIDETAVQAGLQQKPKQFR